MQKTALLATAVALGGAGLYEAAVLRAQSAVLSASGQQTDALRTRISAIRADHADIARKLADTEAQIDVRLSDAGVDAPSRDKALEAQARQWLAQVQRLRDFFVQRPDVIIPELQLLKENDWFTIATSSPLRTEADLRRASSRLRGRAEEHAASVLQQALRAFIAARDGQLPTYPQELAPFCPVPLAPTIFERYEMLATGKAADLARRTEEQNLPPFFAPVLGVRKPNDVELDMYWTLDASGSSYSRPAFAHNLEEARNRFFKTHGARKAPSMQELQPYLRWPLSLEVLENPLRRDAP